MKGNKREYTCIVCPVSCRVTVTEGAEGALDIKGHTCKRGEKFAANEHTDPRRMLTSTVVAEGGALPRLPVIASGEIPKRSLRDCLALLYSVKVRAPIQCGDVVVPDILGLGVDIIASRSMGERRDPARPV